MLETKGRQDRKEKIDEMDMIAAELEKEIKAYIHTTGEK